VGGSELMGMEEWWNGPDGETEVLEKKYFVVSVVGE